MTIGKFPGKCTAFFEAFFEEDYRTHTVPVKKYEPKVFMGKEVPEGATHYLINEDCEHVWLACLDRGRHNPAFYQSGSWYTLPLDAAVRGPIHKLPKQENKLKELTLKDLDDGVIIVMPTGDKFKLHSAGYTIDLVDLSEWYPAHNKMELTLVGHRWVKIPEVEDSKTEEENIMKKEFSKPSDFETGMYLTFGCKREALVVKGYHHDSSKEDVIIYTDGGYDYLSSVFSEHTNYLEYDLGGLASVSWVHPSDIFRVSRDPTPIWKREEKTPEQLAYEALQAQIAEEEARHADSMKALREQAEQLKPKVVG